MWGVLVALCVISVKNSNWFWTVVNFGGESIIFMFQKAYLVSTIVHATVVIKLYLRSLKKLYVD